MTYGSATWAAMRRARWLSVGMMCALTACSTIPGTKFPRQDSRAVVPTDGGVSRILSNADAKQGESAFRMLSVGLDGLAARLELIEHAEKALDLQYYIFRADESGSLIARALLRAADRGVRVRILIDDGETIAGDERLFALAAHPAIQMRVFNPFAYRGHEHVLRALDFLLHKHRLDHRMHNKLMVADNALALIGGRNIGDQYFQIDPESQFGDDDVVAYGPVVDQLSNVYDLFWNSAQAIPIQALDRRHSSDEALAAFRAAGVNSPNLSPWQAELNQRLTTGAPLAGWQSRHDPFVWTTARLIYDSPDKATKDDQAQSAQIFPEFAARAEHSSREILMITPYFVPSEAEMSLLRRATERGVRVAFLTNSLEAAPDVVAHAGYAKHRRPLLAQGVDVHEVRAMPQGAHGTGQSKRMSNHGNFGLHAKLYVFDRQSLFVGSLNFDQRSKHLNTEIGLLVDSPQMAQDAAERFTSLTSLKNAYAVAAGPDASLRWRSEQDGRLVESAREPARSAWQRFEAGFLAILPLDAEL